MNSTNLDEARRTALDRVEKSERTLRNILVVAAMYESLVFVAVLLLIDWASRTHLFMLALVFLMYGSLAFGLVALATYLKRNTLRVLAAIELLD